MNEKFEGLPQTKVNHSPEITGKNSVIANADTAKGAPASPESLFSNEQTIELNNLLNLHGMPEDALMWITDADQAEEVVHILAEHQQAPKDTRRPIVKRLMQIFEDASDSL